MRLTVPVLMLMQIISVLAYLRLGQYGDSASQYHWGVFYHVSNQLYTTAYCSLLLVRTYKGWHTVLCIKMAIAFNLFLAILWCMGEILPADLLVRCISPLRSVLAYLILCILTYTYCIFKKR